MVKNGGCQDVGLSSLPEILYSGQHPSWLIVHTPTISTAQISACRVGKWTVAYLACFLTQQSSVVCRSLLVEGSGTNTFHVHRIQAICDNVGIHSQSSYARLLLSQGTQTTNSSAGWSFLAPGTVKGAYACSTLLNTCSRRVGLICSYLPVQSNLRKLSPYSGCIEFCFISQEPFCS